MNQKNNNAKMLNSKIKKLKKNRVKDPCKVDENQHPWV